MYAANFRPPEFEVGRDDQSLVMIEIRFRIINVIILKSESWLHSSPSSRGPFINYVDKQGRRGISKMSTILYKLM